MGTSTRQINELGYRFDFVCTLPKQTAATEKMVARSLVVGRGTAFYFSPDIIGKTLKITDSTATVATEKTITFVRSDFVGQAPTLAEIVTKLNSVLDDDVTPTVASSGADGRLVITGAATGTTNALTIGAGTANVLFGFPSDGVKLKIDNTATTGGIQLIFPATFSGVGLGDEWLKVNNPRTAMFTYTASTGVHVQNTTFTATWTPSTKTLQILDTSNAASVVHGYVEI